MSEILSVSEITGLVKQTLENEFDEVSVIGEISNFKAHVSGIGISLSKIPMQINNNGAD